MKILILLSNPSVGGTETFVASIVPFFEKHSIYVDILNTWHHSQVKEFAQKVGLNYTELSGNSRHISIKDCRYIARRIKEKKYDIVLGFGIRVSMLLRLLQPWFNKTPILIGLRGLDKWRKWYHIWPDRLTQFLTDIFVPNSNAVAQLRIKREKTPQSKIVVIKNGIDTNYFDKQKFLDLKRENFNLQENKIIAVTVGNFRYQKGHDFLLEVIKKFASKLENTHFVWVGRGALKQSLEQKIASANLAEKITMLDYTKDVRPILAYSDIFVLPSREEGMPRALMEAMSMSLPCVATDVGGTNEVIENGKNGFLADFADTETFGNHIKKLADNTDLRLQMATEARKRIVEHFNIETITGQYVKLFELIKIGERNGTSIQQILDNSNSEQNKTSNNE